MGIIIKGAEELKLDPKYIQNLKAIPLANVSKFLEFLARKNYFFIGFLFRQKLRTVVTGISKASWFFYYPGFAAVPSSAFFSGVKKRKLNGVKVSVVDIAEETSAVGSAGGSVGGSVGVSALNAQISAIRSYISSVCIMLVILPGKAALLPSTSLSPFLVDLLSPAYTLPFLSSLVIHLLLHPLSFSLLLLSFPLPSHFPSYSSPLSLLTSRPLSPSFPPPIRRVDRHGDGAGI